MVETGTRRIHEHLHIRIREMRIREVRVRVLRASDILAYGKSAKTLEQEMDG